MKTQLKINGELKDVEIEGGEITIIEPEKKATGWERKKEGAKYFHGGATNSHIIKEEFSDSDDTIYRTANYFSSNELARNITRMQMLQRQMFRWQAENDVNFETRMDAVKYTISNDSLYGIHVHKIYEDVGFLPCFSSREKAQECIEAFKDGLTWLFAEFRWRMDDEIS